MARDSLKFDLNRLSLSGHGEHAHKQVLSDLTIKSYKAANEKFARFVKSEYGIKTFAKLKEAGTKEVVQAYADYLKAEGKTAHTIHTYIAPICKACNLNMDQIEKGKRTSAEIKRGRYMVERSEREANLGRYKPSVDLQKSLGIRRNELQNLTGGDLVRAKDGRLYVVVKSGKGGKRQLQRVLPQHEKAVLDAFAGKAETERILSSDALSKNINYHGYRSDIAKEAYRYYCNLSAPEREKLRQFLILKYERMGHPSDRALKKFKSEVYNDKPYRLRGENLKLALAKGLPIEYDRLALLGVSVEHLSHWRLDVTINNYMLS